MCMRYYPHPNGRLDTIIYFENTLHIFVYDQNE